MNKFFHSVYLDPNLCKGCINCIKRCPTQAIRVRNGKARITSQFCIDCGECVRTCSHHAKKIRSDSLDILEKYTYTVALPSPEFYAQFNHLYDINILLTALIYLGFDDVFEVSAAAEFISSAARKYVSEHKEHWPYINTGCPSIVRLIRVSYPNLIEHLLPLNLPAETAASLARRRAIEKTGLSPEQIGIIFISPCPSKVTHVKSPLGKDHSEIDGILAAKDIYPLLLPHMLEAESAPMSLSMSGSTGIGWGFSGGEAAGLMTDNYLVADGIENVIRVLDDLEDEKFSTLQFIELHACSGGCVGGVLNVENPYVAKVKLKNLSKSMPLYGNHGTIIATDADLYWNTKVEYEPVFRLGSNMLESITKMKQIDELCQEFPGLDCGSCGAPTCRALAEDIVRGKTEKNDCVHILREHIHMLQDTYTRLAREAVISGEDPDTCIHMLVNYVEKLTDEVSQLDSRNLQYSKKETQHDA